MQIATVSFTHQPQFSVLIDQSRMGDQSIVAFMDGLILKEKLCKPNHFINYKFAVVVCQSSWESSQIVLNSRVFGFFSFLFRIAFRAEDTSWLFP